MHQPEIFIKGLGRQMITYISHDILSHVLTQEGAQIALEGSHEARVWAALPAKGEGTPISVKVLKERLGDETTKVGQGNAFKNGWIAKEGEGFVKKVSIWDCVYAVPDSHKK